MIKKFLKYLLAFFNEIYLFESYKNQKKISYRNYFLKKYNSKKKIKNKVVLEYLVRFNKFERFKNNETLLVLFFKKKAVCFGWLSKKSIWKITEINKIIFKKKTLILYDFFTEINLRNRGFYTKILNLIKNTKTRNKFLIYCLKNNESSKKGIKKAKFVLVDKLKGI